MALPRNTIVSGLSRRRPRPCPVVDQPCQDEQKVAQPVEVDDQFRIDVFAVPVSEANDFAFGTSADGTSEMNMSRAGCRQGE